MATKTKKSKVPPMTEARKAIFARFNDEENAQQHHEHLTKMYDNLKAGWPDLPYTENKETNGNLILVACYEARQEREQRQIARFQMGRKHSADFRRIFGVPLGRYFDHQFGFNSIQFDDDIVKSGDDSCRDAVQRKWGDEGLAIILDLMK